MATHKTNTRNQQTSGDGRMNNGVKCLEETLQFSQQLYASQKCSCLICHTDFIPRSVETVPKLNQYKKDKALLKLYNALCVSGVSGLKINFPDICFMQGDMLTVFYCENKQNRLVRMSGTVAGKAIYSTLLKLKINYKSVLEENFKKNMLDKIDPDCMHEKYLNQLLPSHFHDGFDSAKLHDNKRKTKQYIFHKNPSYIIPAIEQHKLNENQPFCVVFFTDGNNQLFTQKQFELLVMLKVPSDISYVQSFIKPKKQAESIFTSQYTQFGSSIDKKLFELAEIEVMVLIGGLDKYSEKFKDLQQLEDNAIDLMKLYPQSYANYSTYRIVHYLAMVSRLYIKHIKINWVLNDVGHLYVQNVFELETTELSERPLRFRLPPKGQNLEFYKNSQHFLILYHEMKILKQSKKQRIRAELLAQRKRNNSTQQSKILTARSTIDRTTVMTNRESNLLPLNRLSRTFIFPRNGSKQLKNKTNSLQKGDRYQNKLTKATFFHSQRRKRIDSMLQKYNY